MAYLVDRRDVEFNLFELPKIQELKKYSAYSELSEEDFHMLLDESLKFAEKELAPLYRLSDQEGCRFENGKVFVLPAFKKVYQDYAQNGLIGASVPTTYGGQGFPISLTTAFSEFFGGACVSFCMFPGLTSGAAHLIENFGTPNLAKRFCTKMYSGEWLGTMCLTEPQAGSAVGDLKTSAQATDQEGVYRIKGSKIFISCGDHDIGSNIIHLVLARVEGDPLGTKGISLFAVPKIRVKEDDSLGELNDVHTVNIEEKMGLHGSPTCSLFFGDEGQCLGYLVGERCQGMSYMFQMMNEARLACGMQGLSLAGNAYLHAVQHAKERIQGGGNAIIEYPDIRRMLVTMKAYVEGMRALLYRVGYEIDLAKQETDPEKKSFHQGLADFLTPVCKAFCSDKGFEVTEIAIQVHGGYGYIQEYPVEQMMRDVKVSSIYEGANGIQALDLVGRKMAIKGGKLFQNYYFLLQKFSSDHAAFTGLEKEVAEFQKALEVLGQAAMKMGEASLSGDVPFALLQATPFLNMVGYLSLAWLLLGQAFLASTKLKEIWSQKNAGTEEEKSQIAETDSEAVFYETKIETARFYIWNLLPELRAQAKGIFSENRSALKIRF